MSDETLPKDRFAWLGSPKPPEGIQAIPDSTPVGAVSSQIVGPGDSLGIFRWLITPEDERPSTPSGCRLLDVPVVQIELPREGS
jgi:hypothetical protein